MSSLLRKSHSSVSSSAFYHLINSKTKLAPLTNLIFRSNYIAKDFRKDLVEWEDWLASAREDNKILSEGNR